MVPDAGYRASLRSVERNPLDISVNGEELVALPAGALYLPARETLIVSDLHFEKGSHFAARGLLLPPYDTRSTLRRLATVMKAHRPKRVISLGDAFHDGAAESRMDEGDAGLLRSLTLSADWVWILGNHDQARPARFAGRVERTLRVGRLILRHEPLLATEAGEIAGHLHPAARVRADARIIRRRCFATDGERLVMPAFGAYAGGLNVLDDAFAPLFGDFQALVLGAAGVYAFSSGALLLDPQTDHRRTGAA
jgi:hypothetical protein